MTISELATLLRKAKQAENEAKAERLRIEGLIEEQFAKPESGEGIHKDEEFYFSMIVLPSRLLHQNNLAVKETNLINQLWFIFLNFYLSALTPNLFRLEIMSCPLPPYTRGE